MARGEVRACREERRGRHGEEKQNTQQDSEHRTTCAGSVPETSSAATTFATLLHSFCYLLLSPPAIRGRNEKSKGRGGELERV